MNLPNKLTVLRMLLIPVFLWCNFNYYYPWDVVVFAAAAATDALDGHIARKRGLVTDFGKLMDPLADKLLTMSAFVVLLQSSPINIIILIIILSREFLVTSVRLVAASSGKILAADKWGKLKTVLQMGWIIYALIVRNIDFMLVPVPWIIEPVIWVDQVLFFSMVFVTVASGINYCAKNRELFNDA